MFKKGGAGDGQRAGELGLASIPQGGLLAFDERHAYHRASTGWGVVPSLRPGGNPYFTDVASGHAGPTWLASETQGQLLTRYECH